MNDVLKSGGVDVVLTAEPFVTRMTQAGTRSRSGPAMPPILPRTEPIIFYAGGARLGREKT